MESYLHETEVKIMVVAKKKFEWKILLKKFAINAAIVLAAGLASVYGENPMYLAIAPMIKAGLNYWKHK